MGIGVHQFKNIFSEEDLKYLNNSIDSIVIPMIDGEYTDNKNNQGIGLNKELGRVQYGGLRDIDSINNKIIKLVNELSPIPLTMAHVMSVEYSGKYGQPVLPPHFDHDTNDLVVDFQLSANTSWGLGVDKKVYDMLDNSAVIFNANEHIHWRPHKNFKDEEYVRMIFWRFFDPANPSDYSHLDFMQGDDIFKDVREFRDSVGWQ